MSIIDLYSAESWSISTALCVLSGNDEVDSSSAIVWNCNVSSGSLNHTIPMIPLVRQCLSTALKYTSCSVVSMFSSQDVILVHITVNVFFSVFDAKELYMTSHAVSAVMMLGPIPSKRGLMRSSVVCLSAVFGARRWLVRLSVDNSLLLNSLSQLSRLYAMTLSVCLFVSLSLLPETCTQNAVI